MYKVGARLISKNTCYMISNNKNTNELFLKKHKVYIIDRVDSLGGDSAIYIKSEHENSHGIGFSVIPRFFYTLKEYRRQKLKKINSVDTI